jgi:hypothetical protein
MRRVRVCGERRRALQHEPEVIDQRCAAAAAALAKVPGSRGEERGGPRPCAPIVNQPGAGHRGEQIVAVDHLVVEYRRSGARTIAVQVIQHRALADVLLVRNLPLH